MIEFDPDLVAQQAFLAVMGRKESEKLARDGGGKPDAFDYAGSRQGNRGLFWSAVCKGDERDTGAALREGEADSDVSAAQGAKRISE